MLNIVCALFEDVINFRYSFSIMFYCAYIVTKTVHTRKNFSQRLPHLLKSNQMKKASDFVYAIKVFNSNILVILI